MKITKRGHLSDQEKEMVRRLYTEFGRAGTEIAASMEVGASTIYRCLKGLERGEEKELTGKMKAELYQAQATKPPENDHEKTPLQFSQSQLAELRQDINLSRMRGSVNVLPQLHRLYREVYKEIQALVKSLKKTSPRNKMWWLVGGIVVGSTATYGAYRAFDER